MSKEPPPNGDETLTCPDRPEFTRSASEPPSPIHDTIGPYKIIETLGEGGMGIVYLAEQSEPIRRRVALKVIKPGMDSKAVIARFESERQALALMDHPGVAKVFDAGTTEQGRPYFVMELVSGVPITEHCDREQLRIDDRLALFMDVCEAVQHAHQKGIIHRDIKPSNILVSLQEGKPVAKVIDFGVAKAIEQRLTEKTLFTEQGQPIGTPAYMSPEQAEMTALDIDTRTDIYSLGVLFYELLVGAPPFDPESLRHAAFGRIQQIIREQDPPKPSTRLSSLGDESAAIAQRRRANVRELVGDLRGDLDWITMKALEKDRARRYATATAFAEDIERYLRHEPVVASPPSATYRLGKFARRNRGPLVAVAAVFLVLVGGVVTSTSQYLRAEEGREGALRARDDSEAVVQFLSNMLASVSPGIQGKDVTMRAVLDEAAKTIGDELGDRPLIEARLRRTIASSYRALGLYDPAEDHDRAAVAICRRLLGEEHPDTLQSLYGLGFSVGSQGRYVEWEALERKTLAVRRRVLGDEHPDTLESVNALANSLAGQGRWTEAETLYRETFNAQRRVLGEEHVRTLQSMNNLANCIRGQGRFDEAAEIEERVVAIRRRVLGNGHPGTLQSMSNLANTLLGQRRFEEAETLLRETMEIQQSVLGDEHPDTLGSMMNLANSLRAQRRYAEAEEFDQEALAIRRRTLGEDHPFTLNSMNNLALTLRERGRLAEATELDRKTVAGRRRVLGDDHPDTLRSMMNLANNLRAQGRYAEAEEFDREALAINRRVLGEEHPLTLGSMHNLALSLRLQGKLTEATELDRKTLGGQRRVLGDDHPDTLASMNNLAYSLQCEGQFAEAEELQRETLSRKRRVHGAKHPDTLGSMDNLAHVLNAQGKHDEARPLVEELLAAYHEEAAQPDATPSVLNRYAMALLTYEPADLQDPPRALPFAQRAVEESNWADPAVIDTLALAYFMTGEVAKAVEAQERAIALLPPEASPLRVELEANLARFRAALKEPGE